MKLSKAEFADELQKGKGRVYLHMRDHGDEGIEDALLEACLRNLTHDTQCEYTREQWLVGLTDLAKNPRYYHDGVADNFLKTTEFNDVLQQSAILRLLASRGYPNARELLYQKYDLQEFTESYLIGEDIIKLDGAAGMLHVADVIGKRIRDDSSYWESNMLISTIERPHDKQQIAATLCEAAKSNPNVNAYVENVLATSGELVHDSGKSRKLASSPALSLDEFLTSVNASPAQITLGECFRFGENAAPEDLKKVFSLLLAEKDEKRLWHYLSAFRRAEMPEVHPLVFSFASSANDKIKYAALNALAGVRNPVIREFVLTRLNQGEFEGLNILAKNFEEGDFSRIFAKIRGSGNPDVLHSVAWDIFHICDQHNNVDATDCLLWAYEQTPCAVCRGRAVRMLLDIGMLSDALAKECALDCDAEIQAMVMPAT